MEEKKKLCSSSAGRQATKSAQTQKDTHNRLTSGHKPIVSQASDFPLLAKQSGFFASCQTYHVSFKLSQISAATVLPEAAQEITDPAHTSSASMQTYFWDGIPVPE